jgi:hypothetical protein
MDALRDDPRFKSIVDDVQAFAEHRGIAPLEVVQELMYVFEERLHTPRERELLREEIWEQLRRERDNPDASGRD